MSELCSYCFNATTIEGPHGEEVPCPVCQPTSALREGAKNATQLACEAWGVEYTGEEGEQDIIDDSIANQESEDL